MSGPTYRVARLSPSYDLTSFDCGVETYNEWLIQHAAASEKAGVCAVYLLVEQSPTDTRVVGYYAISPTQVVREQAPASLSRGWPNAVPAWKLGKLAIHAELRADRSEQWGRQLLRDALQTIVAVAEAGGGKVIVVDADNVDLVAFYARNGFRPAGEGSLTMYMKVSTARKALAD